MHLRSTYLRKSATLDNVQSGLAWGFFLGYWPAVYALSRTFKPGSIALFSLAYYFGAYKKMAQPFALYSFQGGLNSAAQPLAKKYAVKAESSYLE